MFQPQRPIRTARVMILALFMVVSLSLSAPAGETISIGGAGAWLPVMKRLADAFEKSHPGTSVVIKPNLGSSGGILALLDGKIDIAVSARSLKAGEITGGAVAVPCARTPFAFIVHKSVQKENVSTGELEMIYAEKQKQWPDGSRIRLVHRLDNDTDTQIIKGISAGLQQALQAAGNRQDRLLAVTDQDAVAAVERISGALGGATLAHTVVEKRTVKLLTYNGVKPTVSAVANGSYPLVKQLYLVTTPRTSSRAAQFVTFVRSSRGGRLLADCGALQSGESGAK